MSQHPSPDISNSMAIATCSTPRRIPSPWMLSQQLMLNRLYAQRSQQQLTLPPTTTPQAVTPYVPHPNHRRASHPYYPPPGPQFNGSPPNSTVTPGFTVTPEAPPTPDTVPSGSEIPSTSGTMPPPPGPWSSYANYCQYYGIPQYWNSTVIQGSTVTPATITQRSTVTQGSTVTPSTVGSEAPPTPDTVPPGSEIPSTSDTLPTPLGPWSSYANYWHYYGVPTYWTPPINSTVTQEPTVTRATVTQGSTVTPEAPPIKDTVPSASEVPSTSDTVPPPPGPWSSYANYWSYYGVPQYWTPPGNSTVTSATVTPETPPTQDTVPSGSEIPSTSDAVPTPPWSSYANYCHYYGNPQYWNPTVTQGSTVPPATVPPTTALQRTLRSYQYHQVAARTAYIHRLRQRDQARTPQLMLTDGSTVGTVHTGDTVSTTTVPTVADTSDTVLTGDTVTTTTGTVPITAEMSDTVPTGDTVTTTSSTVVATSSTVPPADTMPTTISTVPSSSTVTLTTVPTTISTVPPSGTVPTVVPDNVEIKLANMEKWEVFGELQNEMTVSHNGNRFFPTLKYIISGLNPTEIYRISVCMDPFSPYNYKFNNPTQKWIRNEYFDALDGACGEDIGEKVTGAELMANADSSLRTNELRMYYFRPYYTGRRRKCKDGWLRDMSNDVYNGFQVEIGQKYVPILTVYHCQGEKETKIAEKWFPETSFITTVKYRHKEVRELKKTCRRENS